MRIRAHFLVLSCLLLFSGCSKKKTTAQLLQDLKAPEERARLIAVRLLPERKADAAQVVPALSEALKDKSDDVRLSAAIGLGYFGEQARSAIAALQEAQEDRDPRVRKQAGVALSRIDPTHFPAKDQGIGR